ncbi:MULTISPECIES: class C sortase [Peptoniphilus]|uniref:class C sortase n=1 Tax=Peptoniphilus TaxID=162289 RepID=UPI000566C0E1|nr:class C sortase [Peptoniphilus sp. oral taxon 836]
MKNRRIVFGYILIIIGILLPLYGFFGLSRGIVLDKREYRKFMASEVDPKLEDKMEGYNNSIGKESVIVDPFATEEYTSNYSFMEDPDAIFCYLKIPKLDLVQPVYMDASNKHMAMGVAHIEGTDLPGVKKGIRSVIAGHRGYYDAIMFLHLDELFEGDKIYLEWQDRTLEYKVTSKEIISPWEWDKLDPVESKNILTLLTCDPLLPPRPKRLLVNAELLEKEKEADLITDDTKVSPNVKKLNNSILFITGVLVISLCISLVKFAIYLRKSK